MSGTPAPRLEGINPSVSKSPCIREHPGVHDARPAFTPLQWREKLMLRFWISLALVCATPLAYGSAGSVDEVEQWNKTLLTNVRTPGAQPATIHPTRSFAIMHAAIYDAVNAIDATHKPYLVGIEHVSPRA